MTVPSAVLTTTVSASTAKLTGTTTGPESVPNAIRPTPPGAISRRHSAGRSLLMTRMLARRRGCAGAEERGRRGLQGGGELPERERARPGRVPLQVLHVPQAQSGARCHLRLAQVQFRTPQRDPLAQVARVRRRRPPACLVLRFGPGYVINGHRIAAPAARPGLGAASPPRLCQLSCRVSTRTSSTLTRAKPGGEWPPARPAGTFVHRTPAGP